MSAPESILYKEYIQRLRKLELEEIHLNVVEDISPQLKKILKRILTAEFRNGFIHSYFGKVDIPLSPLLGQLLLYEIVEAVY